MKKQLSKVDSSLNPRTIKIGPGGIRKAIKSTTSKLAPPRPPTPTEPGYTLPGVPASQRALKKTTPIAPYTPTSPGEILPGVPAAQITPTYTYTPGEAGAAAAGPSLTSYLPIILIFLAGGVVIYLLVRKK